MKEEEQEFLTNRGLITSWLKFWKNKVGLEEAEEIKDDSTKILIDTALGLNGTLVTKLDVNTLRPVPLMDINYHCLKSKKAMEDNFEIIKVL